jgi:hypothetical protein
VRLLSTRRLVAGLVLASTLAACGGSSGGGGSAPVGQASSSDPVATVNSFVATLQAKALDKLPALACAAAKDSIGNAFNPAGALASTFGSVSAADALGAVNVDVSGVTVGTAQVNGDKATVPLKATIKVTIDKNKLTDLIKKAAGGAIDDATLQAALAAVPTDPQTTPLDTSVPLVKEGGSWLICQ